MTVSDDDLSSLINEELLARHTKVMYLKNAGATWAQIAAQVGVSVATCRKDMAIVQRDINNERPDQVVARHRAVIFDIQRANYPAMMRGDKDAAMVILRALHREANLLGLDSPTRVLATVSAEDFANEAARLIESITNKDIDTLKELTHGQRPLDAEEVPLPEPDAVPRLADPRSDGQAAALAGSLMERLLTERNPGKLHVVAPPPTHPSAPPEYLDKLASPTSPTTTDGPTFDIGTSPNCGWIGGHADGYDPECAHCHRQAEGLPPMQAERLTHTTDLVERHRITLPVGATGDNVAVARLHAEAWAEWNGLEIRPESFEVITAMRSPYGTPPQYLGVAFDVVIGKGDVDTDHRGRGAADAWTWSARWQHWRNVFNGMGRQGRLIARREDGLASVSRIGQYVAPPEGRGLGDPTREPGVEPYHGKAQTAREQLGLPDVGDSGIKIQRGGVRLTDEPADQRPPWLRRGEGWDED